MAHRDPLRSLVIKAGDTLFLDRGYYSYENYVIGIAKYKIVPVIFPRVNCKFNKLFDMLCYPLNIFDSKRNTENEKKLFKRLVAKFKSLIKNWKELRPIRSLIEDAFKLAKKACNMENLHRYTMRSVKKYCSLAVFLTGAVIAFCVSDKRYVRTLGSRVRKKRTIIQKFSRSYFSLGLDISEIQLRKQLCD